MIIPRSNLEHLMLDEDVIEAVKKGKFHVWAVSSVDEGMELLTGVSAGKWDGKSRYPTGTVNRLAADRLDEMARSLRDYR